MKHRKRLFILLLTAVLLAGMLPVPAAAGDILIWNPIAGADYCAKKVFDLDEYGKYTYTTESDETGDDFLAAIMNGIGTGDTAIATPFFVTEQGEDSGVYTVVRKPNIPDRDVIAFLDSVVETGIWERDDLSEFGGGTNGDLEYEIDDLEPGYYYITTYLDYGDDYGYGYSRAATVNVGENVVNIVEKTMTEPKWGENGMGKGIVESVLDEDGEVIVAGKDIVEIWSELRASYDDEDYSIKLVDTNSANIGEDILFHIAVDTPTYVKDADGNLNLITWLTIHDEIDDGFEYSFIKEEAGEEGEDSHYWLDNQGFAVFFRPYIWDEGEWKLDSREESEPFDDYPFDYDISADYCYRFEGLEYNAETDLMEFAPSVSGGKPDLREFTLQIPFGTTFQNNIDSPFVRIEVFYHARLKPDAENVKIANLCEPDEYDIANLNTASFSYFTTPVDDEFDPDDYDYTDVWDVWDEYPDPEGDPVFPDKKRTTETYTYALIIEKYAMGDDSHLLPGAAFSLTPPGTDVSPMVFYATNANGVYVPRPTADEVELNALLETKKFYDNLSEDMEEKEPESFIRMNVLLTKGTTEPFVGGVEGNDNEEEYPMIGRLLLLGLAAGTYSVDETKAPEGYRKMDKPRSMTIGLDADSEEVLRYDYNYGFHHHKIVTHQDAEDEHVGFPVVAYRFQVEDSPDFFTLPETGSVGTRLFILFGSLTALCAGLVLITNKRICKGDFIYSEFDFF